MQKFYWCLVPINYYFIFLAFSAYFSAFLEFLNAFF
jgi:hypothetical protein